MTKINNKKFVEALQKDMRSLEAPYILRLE